MDNITITFPHAVVKQTDERDGIAIFTHLGMFLGFVSNDQLQAIITANTSQG